VLDMSKNKCSGRLVSASLRLRRLRFVECLSRCYTTHSTSLRPLRRRLAETSLPLHLFFDMSNTCQHCSTLHHAVIHCKPCTTRAGRPSKEATILVHSNSTDRRRVFPKHSRDYICNALQRTATHCTTLQHTATHCNTLHTACKPLTQHSHRVLSARFREHTFATHCKKHTATHCHTLPRTAIHCHTLPHTAQ